MGDTVRARSDPVPAGRVREPRDGPALARVGGISVRGHQFLCGAGKGNQIDRASRRGCGGILQKVALLHAAEEKLQV